MTCVGPYFVTSIGSKSVTVAGWRTPRVKSLTWVLRVLYLLVTPPLISVMSS